MTDERAVIAAGIRVVNQLDVDAIPDVLHPEVEFTSIFTPMEGVYQGHDGVRAYLEDLKSAFDDFELELGRTTPVADDFLVELHVKGRGRGSGVAFERTIGQIWTFRDGLIWRLIAHPTLEEAQAALGLDT